MARDPSVWRMASRRIGPTSCSTSCARSATRRPTRSSREIFDDGPGRVRQPPHEDARAQRRRARPSGCRRAVRRYLDATDDLPGLGRPGADRASASASSASTGRAASWRSRARRCRPATRRARASRCCTSPRACRPTRCGASARPRSSRSTRWRPAASRRAAPACATPRRCGSCTPRCAISSARSEAWDPDWGVPINQEDLAGTLMTFSIVVLDSLRKLGVSISDEEPDAYFHAWNCVGHVLGVDARLLAATRGDGRALSQRDHRAPLGAVPGGPGDDEALIETMEHATPGTIFDGFPSYIVRYLGGDELGDILGVRRQDWTRLLGGPLRLFAARLRRVDRPRPAVGARSPSTSAGSCWRASAGSPAAASGRRSTSRASSPTAGACGRRRVGQRTRNVTARLREPR